MTRERGEGIDPSRVPVIIVAAVDAADDPRARCLVDALQGKSVGDAPSRVELFDPEVPPPAASAWVVIGDPHDRGGPRAEAIAEAIAGADGDGAAVLRLDHGGTAVSPDAPPGLLAEVLRVLVAQSDSTRRAIRRERLAREVTRRHDHELAEAALLQREFLPKRLPRHHRFECAVLWRPAWHVSGDIYDVVRIDEHHVGIFLADAVGHGVPAAILAMGLARRLEVQDADLTPLPPSEVLRRLNRSLTEIRGDLVWFATAVYALYDLRTAEVRLASAGHPSAILLRRDGEAVAIDASGGLLGIFEEERYLEHAFRLESGDRLILHSDGIEPLFQAGCGADGAPRGDAAGSYLARFAADAAGREAPELFEDLVARIERSDLAPIATDDVTVITLGYGPVAATSEPSIEGEGMRFAA